MQDCCMQLIFRKIATFFSSGFLFLIALIRFLHRHGRFCMRGEPLWDTLLDYTHYCCCQLDQLQNKLISRVSVSVVNKLICCLPISISYLQMGCLLVWTPLPVAFHCDCGLKWIEREVSHVRLDWIGIPDQLLK